MKIIRYNLINQINVGTVAEPIWEKFMGYQKEIRCSAETLEANYAIAVAEAWNGEVTVEDDGQPAPEPPASDTPTWDELAAAIKEGVDSV